MIRIPDASWHVSVSLSASIPGQHLVDGISNAAVSLKNFVPEVCNSNRKREPHAAGELQRRQPKKARRSQPQAQHGRDRSSKKDAASACFLFPKLRHEAGEDMQAGLESAAPSQLLLPHGNGSEAVRIRERGSKRMQILMQDEEEEEDPARLRPNKTNKIQAGALQSRNAKRKRKRNNNTEQGNPEHQGEASLSLFGMGLLHRLEQQAKQSRKRLTNSAKQKALADRKGLQGQNVRKTAAPEMQLQQRGLYALDDRCIYNFKDAQASACFPRQSAHEACQAGLPCSCRSC